MHSFLAEFRMSSHSGRKDSFLPDSQSRGRGATKANCFFLITEFRLTHCRSFAGGETFGYDSTSLFFPVNTQHSCGREKAKEESAPSCAAGMVRSKG